LMLQQFPCRSFLLDSCQAQSWRENSRLLLL
jgi:hypothetical protein